MEYMSPLEIFCPYLKSKPLSCTWRAVIIIKGGWWRQPHHHNRDTKQLFYFTFPLPSLRISALRPQDRTNTHTASYQPHFRRPPFLFILLDGKGKKCRKWMSVWEIGTTMGKTPKHFYLLVINIVSIILQKI